MEPKSEDETGGGQKVASIRPKKLWLDGLRNGLVGPSVGAVLTKSRAIQGWVWCHKTKGQSDS